MRKTIKRSKPTLGDIVAIPLPDGKYAFAKVFRDREYGIYDLVSDRLEDVSVVLKREIAFFQAATHDPLVSGQWAVIGAQAFPDDDSAWPPPQATGIFPGMPIIPEMLRLKVKGEAHPATLGELAGLDISTFCSKPEGLIEVIVDRLIKNDQGKYRVRP